MPKNEIDDLILRHLGDIEAASKRIAKILQPEISKTLNKVVHDWAKPRGWDTGKDFDKSDLWLAPPDWKATGGNKWHCQFWLGAGEGDDPNTGWEDEYWLSQLCGVGGGVPVGIKWEPNFGARKTQLRRFLADYVAELRGLGFQYSERGSFFLVPFRIDSTSLAKALEDEALEEAMEPLKKALDQIEPAKSAFDRILVSAKKQFEMSA